MKTETHEVRVFDTTNLNDKGYFIFKGLKDDANRIAKEENAKNAASCSCEIAVVITL